MYNRISLIINYHIEIPRGIAIKVNNFGKLPYLHWYNFYFLWVFIFLYFYLRNQFHQPAGLRIFQQNFFSKLELKILNLNSNLKFRIKSRKNVFLIEKLEQ